MQPLLESFESFFYVLVNTLPAASLIGLAFFGLGYLFTNPRIKRLRQQIANYKEEVQRMSRRQAQVTTQHQELLENLQAVENENLALQSSLETKNDELIGLLDRLNNIAGDAEPATAIADSESATTENTRLRKRIAELTGRLRTSESALQDRKVELARARNELARVGVPQEAATRGGSSGGDQGWRPDLPGLGEDDHLSPPDDTADSSALRDAADAFVDQQTAFVDRPAGPGLSGSDPDPSFSIGSLESTAARIFSGANEEVTDLIIPGDEGELRASTLAEITADPAADLSTADPAADVSTADPAADLSTADPAADLSTADPAADLSTADPAADDSSIDDSRDDSTREEETTALEDQLAQFEERLRAREAEFFALQEQLSFGSLGSISTLPAQNIESDSGAAPATPVTNDAATASETTGTSKPADISETDSPFPPLAGKTAPLPPLPPLQLAAPAIAPSRQLAPGEQLIFRGSDPALWGKQSSAGLINPSDIRKSTKFLRLRRCDTGQSIIIRISKKHIAGSGSTESVLGWNGKADTHAGIVHLGIYDHSLPQEVETRFGAGGWGFGHHSINHEGQAYSWAGISIPRTDFEISTLSKLPDARTLKETDTTFLESPSIAPSAEDELVFFHSSHPEIWNKNTVDGKGGFALNLSRTPVRTRFLRVRRTDNGSAVVIPISRDKIVLKSGAANQLGWNGVNEFFSAGHHLGICDPASEKEVEIAHGCGGYGFGHPAGSSTDRQAITWAGKAINRIPLEFTAIARDLTEEESTRLLKS